MEIEHKLLILKVAMFFGHQKESFLGRVKVSVFLVHHEIKLIPFSRHDRGIVVLLALTYKEKMTKVF